MIEPQMYILTPGKNEIEIKLSYFDQKTCTNVHNNKVKRGSIVHVDQNKGNSIAKMSNRDLKAIFSYF